MRVERRKGHIRHMHRTKLGKEYLARAVHAHVGLEAHLSPYADAQLVAGPDDIIGWNRSHVQRSKCGGYTAKEVRPEDRQNLARSRGDELLELGQRLRRKQRLLRRIPCGSLPGQLLNIRIIAIGIPRLRTVFPGQREARLRSRERSGSLLSLTGALLRIRQQRIGAVRRTRTLRPCRIATLR